MRDDLLQKASDFAVETADLLNKTVTDGIRISVQSRGDDAAAIGYGLTRSELLPKPLPLAVKGKARVFLYLIHSLSLDHERKYLTATSSTISLYTSAEMASAELIVGMDYTRERQNEYPNVHLHVAGQRSDLDGLYLGTNRKNRQLRDLHLPVGGRRFRPTLEDMIQFAITEEMVKPRSGWLEVVEQYRERWIERQLGALVRRRPEIAADRLKESGWTVTPPVEN